MLCYSGRAAQVENRLFWGSFGMRLNGPSARSQMTEKKIVNNQVVLGREEDRNGINQEGSKSISQQQPDRLRGRQTRRETIEAGEEELEGIHWGGIRS